MARDGEQTAAAFGATRPSVRERLHVVRSAARRGKPSRPSARLKSWARITTATAHPVVVIAILALRGHWWGIALAAALAVAGIAVFTVVALPVRKLVRDELRRAGRFEEVAEMERAAWPVERVLGRGRRAGPAPPAGGAGF